MCQPAKDQNPADERRSVDSCGKGEHNAKDAGNDQDDAADKQPRALSGEAVVAISHGGHRLDSEVERGEEAEVGLARPRAKGEVHHDGGRHDQQELRRFHAGGRWRHGEDL